MIEVNVVIIKQIKGIKYITDNNYICFISITLSHGAIVVVAVIVW
jgi:hypothetical protein